MAINSDQYVSITSVVGGASALSARELILRIMTTNELVPTGSVVEFSDEDGVGTYFGTESDEYKQADYYFGFVSKDSRTPSKISFGRWADADTSAKVFGAEVESLDNLREYTSDGFSVTYGGSTSDVTGLDLSGVASYADVATALQAKLVALGAPFSDFTVTYNAQRAGLDIDSGSTVDGGIKFSSDDLISDLGWDSLAIFSNGVAEQAPADAVSSSASLSNNFGSFYFLDDLDSEQIKSVASWNDGENIKYMFCQRATKNESITWFDQINGYSGLALIGYDEDITDEYPWVLPAALLATIDWEDTGAATNFMFTQDNTLTPLITNTTDANIYDGYRLNYMGVTQESGTELSFFQRGYLMGGTSDPLQMGVYAAEAWFKSYVKAQLLNLLLAVKIVSADDTGEAQVSTTVGNAIDIALSNGMISTGKTLTNTQKAYIASITGDSTAYQSVENKGYWLDTGIDSSTSNGATEYTATYTLIYATREGVNKVEGRDILI